MMTTNTTKSYSFDRIMAALDKHRGTVVVIGLGALVFFALLTLMVHGLIRTA